MALFYFLYLIYIMSFNRRKMHRLSVIYRLMSCNQNHRNIRKNDQFWVLSIYISVEIHRITRMNLMHSIWYKRWCYYLHYTQGCIKQPSRRVHAFPVLNFLWKRKISWFSYGNAQLRFCKWTNEVNFKLIANVMQPL